MYFLQNITPNRGFLMKKIILMLAVLSSGFVAKANPTCTALMNDLITYADDNSNIFRDQNVIDVKITTNRADSKYASYTEGRTFKKEISAIPFQPLDGGGIIKPNPGSPIFRKTLALVGDGNQYFSDRLLNLNANCTEDFCFPDNQIFSKKASDILGISINKDGYTTLTLKSWGNGKISFDGACTNNMLYGVAQDTFFVISFKKAIQPGAPK
jgi:hypothetical protein